MSTILIVDDFSTQRKVVKAHLETLNCTFIEASNGIEALELLKTTAVSLIITDYEMPQMDGFQLAAEVRKMPKYKHLPILMISSAEAAKRKAKWHGVTDWIHKPFDRSHLVEKVKTLCTPVSITPQIVHVLSEDLVKQNLLGTFLKTIGLKTTASTTMIEAWNALREERAKVMVIDAPLKNGDITKLLTKIKETYALKDMKLLGMIEKNGTSYEWESHFHSVVNKPVNPQDLLQHLKKLSVT